MDILTLLHEHPVLAIEGIGLIEASLTSDRPLNGDPAHCATVHTNVAVPENPAASLAVTVTV